MDPLMPLNDLRNYECVRKFLQKVCKPIKARGLHQQVEWELLSHLEESVSELLAEAETQSSPLFAEGVAGSERESIHQPSNEAETQPVFMSRLSHEAAVTLAISRMGDPTELGKQSHQAHKPQTDWPMLVLMIALTLMGFVMMVAIDTADPMRYGFLLQKDSFYTLAGTALLILFYVVDYRKLQRFSWPLFIGAAAFLLYTFNVPEKRMPLYFSQIRLFSLEQLINLSPYLLLLGMIGILHTSKWSQAPVWKSWLLFIILPCLLYIANKDMLLLFLYGICSSAVLFFISRKNHLPVVGFSFASAAALLIFSQSAYFQHRWSYLYERWEAFLKPDHDPYGVGFLPQMINNSLQNTGWLGNGFATSSPRVPFVYYAPNEWILSYLIFSLGWLAGLAVCAITLLFLYRMAKITLAIRDPYGKTLSLGITLVLSIPMIWNIGMITGLLPSSGFLLPFISFGGLHTIVEMAAVGVILGIWRRQRMIPASLQPVVPNALT